MRATTSPTINPIVNPMRKVIIVVASYGYVFSLRLPSLSENPEPMILAVKGEKFIVRGHT